MINKSIKLLSAILAFLSTFAFASCGSDAIKAVTGKDERASSPEYRYGENGERLCFALELRQRSEIAVKEENDAFAHSDTDGELVRKWEVPFFGNTVYEAIKEFFPFEGDDFSFASKGGYCYFKECSLSDGRTYDLQTSYLASNGTYAKTANFEKLAGLDGIFGTADDLKTFVIVYKGWI